MRLKYTYWREPDGFFLGYLNVWPEHWTQGKTVAELEEMLLDLYAIYLEEQQDAAAVPARGAHTGVLELAPA